MDTMTAESPKLKIDISIMHVQGNDQRSHEINNSIAYNLCFCDTTDIKYAIRNFIDTERKIYLSMRPDYIDERAIEHSPAWYNQERCFNGKIEELKKDTLCYKIKITEKRYTDGIQETTNHICLNFDKATGREIGLDDIFAENYEEPLLQLLLKALARKIGANSIDEIAAKGYLPYDDICTTHNFALTADSIIFLYGRNEIAPDSMGEIELALGYDEINNLTIKKQHDK